jgi:putative hydrolase of HD superfamily
MTLTNDIAKYLYEIGQLKRVKRSGWWMVGITDPESVAEHSFRVAILGYILASLEGADPLKVAAMCLFHDTPETRINDPHQLAKRYVQVKEGEKLAEDEQLERLPPSISQSIASLFHDYEERESLESVIAHDADALECLIQAREYQVQGYAEVQDWIDNCYAALKTASAKKLAEASLHVEPQEWWQGLKKRV